jgi:L-methionine (R)-S-oxide reductase
VRASFGCQGLLIYDHCRFLLQLIDYKVGTWVTKIVTQDISIICPNLIARIHALCKGEEDPIAIMATVSAELFHSVDGFDWIGFYRVVAPDLLNIGPYQSGHGCLAIPFDSGVCGAAARQRAIQLVDDVDCFEGHIACSSTTKSELVIPCFNQGGHLLGVQDIDSDQPNFFTWQDADQLDQMLRQLFKNASL